MARALWAGNPLDGMSDQERVKQFIHVFSWIQDHGGRMPLEAYMERCHTFPTVHLNVVNLAPLYGGIGHEILLDLKPPEDKHYGGTYATQGGTVMMRQRVSDLLEKHIKEESLVQSESKFRFCGIVLQPLVSRHHAVIMVFGRLLERKPTNYQGVWVRVADLTTIPIKSSERLTINLVVDVLLDGGMPRHLEYQGTEV